MRELIAKIEELRKTLAAMKPKSASANSLVPAMKMPTVKPLTMPSASSAASPKPKLPGISPATNKDPKKVAEQLKDPKPTKPKIDVLKVESNGQWSLDKAEWDKHHKKMADDWAISGLRPLLDKLPPATGKLKTAMLNDLSRDAQTRINPATNQREFLLHRAMPVGGHETDFHGKNRSSWTAHPKFAKYWAGIQSEGYLPPSARSESANQQQVVSSWVPQHKIHSYMPTALGPNHEKYGEQEAIVEPHDIVPHKIRVLPAQKMKKFGENNSV